MTRLEACSPVAVLTVAGRLWDAARLLQAEGGWTVPGWPWLTADRCGMWACAWPVGSRLRGR